MPPAGMLCGVDGLTEQFAAGVPLAGTAFELKTVSCVGLMPDTASDDVMVCVTWIVAGLVSEPVTITGAEREFELFAPVMPGTHVRAPPVVIFAVVVERAVQRFVAGLYDQKVVWVPPRKAQIVVPSVARDPPAPTLAGVFFRFVHFPVVAFGTNLENLLSLFPFSA